MALPIPNLDDRTFKDLLEEAKLKAQQICPDWDLDSVSDPGVVLLELFSYLTEIMLYRVNKIPEKVYVEFLQLMGIQLQPPSSASVKLKFYRNRMLESRVTIPKGTRVTTVRASGSENPPVFVTARAINLESLEAEANVLAYHCEIVEAELLGYGNGMPGLSVGIQNAPVIAPTDDEEGDLQIGIEAVDDELDDTTPFKELDGKKYWLWTMVDNFTDSRENDYVFTADRMTGVITFAPLVSLKNSTTGKLEPEKALAQVPKNGREIRSWYKTGGGVDGNVAGNTLIRIKDPIPGIQVINEFPALGGQVGETIENAMLRGPSELRSLERVVTARDFELVAKRNSGAVARASAYTKADLWPYALPGTVEVLLAPKIPEDQVGDGPLTVDMLQQHHTDEVLARVKYALNERRPLGTTCDVRWVRYKPVVVKAKLVIDREHNADLVKKQVLKNLNRMINPLPDGKGYAGWHFGQTLHISRVYGLIMAQPGIRYIDGQVKLAIEQAPTNATSIAPDAFKPDVWYFASGDSVYRSVNNCEGWELAQTFDGEKVLQVASHPAKAGIVTALTKKSEGSIKRSRLYLSRDCGESWEMEHILANFSFPVYNVSWIPRANDLRLLVATQVGLYEVRPGKGPVQIAVGPSDQDGFTAVAVTADPLRTIRVAVAGRQGGGIYISNSEGHSNSFESLELNNEEVRVLAIQEDGSRNYLWAGLAAIGNMKGKGCYVYDLTNPAAGWKNYNEGWRGGSCYSITFDSTHVYAGSFRGGVLKLSTSKTKPAWESLPLSCGLPIRPDSERLYPIQTVAVTLGKRGRLLAGTSVGIFSADQNQENLRFQECSHTEFVDKVTLPDTWLFCSGRHDIEVIEERYEG